MRFLNIGLPELIFLGLLALIILGPDRIVHNAKVLGAWLRHATKTPLWKEFVTTSQEIRDLPRKVMQDSGLDDTLQDLNQTSKTLHDLPRSLSEDSGFDETLEQINQSTRSAGKEFNHFDKAPAAGQHFKDSHPSDSPDKS